jgi:hypothetical protein
MGERMERRKRLLIPAIIIAIVAVVPRKICIVPEYHVNVSDTSGAPFRNVKLHQLVQDYSFGGELESSSDVITDSHGNAVFPSRTRWLSAGAEVLACTLQFFQYAVHASCGSYSDITVSDSLVEKARVNVARRYHPDQHSLTLTMASCPSGDYWSCKYPNGLPQSWSH